VLSIKEIKREAPSLEVAAEWRLRINSQQLATKYSKGVSSNLRNAVEVLITAGQIEALHALHGCEMQCIARANGMLSHCLVHRLYIGANIEAAIVKEGLETRGSIHLAPQKAREVIREAARRAMNRVGEIKPFCYEPPYTR
jgi:hypothetical protein